MNEWLLPNFKKGVLYSSLIISFLSPYQFLESKKQNLLSQVIYLLGDTDVLEKYFLLRCPGSTHIDLHM